MSLFQFMWMIIKEQSILLVMQEDLSDLLLLLKTEFQKSKVYI